MEPSADAANTSYLLSRSGSSVYMSLKTYYQECIASFRKKGEWKDFGPITEKDKDSPHVVGEHMKLENALAKCILSCPSSRISEPRGHLLSSLFLPLLCGKVRGRCEKQLQKRDEEGKKLILLPISLLAFAFSVSDHRVPGINIFRAKSTSTQPQVWQTEPLLCGLVCLWPSLSAGQVVSSL